ncbi:hypothetical protein CRENBAI_016823 [Crenichthys baileyi]|uniref:Uncharacterized protein n=1 Tax=Crenichthys baileyi TaxID=28760 RepID=A0AAV9REV8_9TELE
MSTYINKKSERRRDTRFKSMAEGQSISRLIYCNDSVFRVLFLWFRLCNVLMVAILFVYASADLVVLTWWCWSWGQGNRQGGRERVGCGQKRKGEWQPRDWQLLLLWLNKKPISTEHRVGIITICCTETKPKPQP